MIYDKSFIYGSEVTKWLNRVDLKKDNIISIVCSGRQYKVFYWSNTGEK